MFAMLPNLPGMDPEFLQAVLGLDSQDAIEMLTDKFGLPDLPQESRQQRVARRRVSESMWEDLAHVVK